jgi:hypothetical protein
MIDHWRKFVYYNVIDHWRKFVINGYYNVIYHWRKFVASSSNIAVFTFATFQLPAKPLGVVAPLPADAAASSPYHPTQHMHL